MAWVQWDNVTLLEVSRERISDSLGGNTVSYQHIPTFPHTLFKIGFYRNETSFPKQTGNWMNLFLYEARVSFVGIVVSYVCPSCLYLSVCVGRRIPRQNDRIESCSSLFSCSKMPPALRATTASYRKIWFWYRQISHRQLLSFQTYLAFGLSRRGSVIGHISYGPSHWR